MRELPRNRATTAKATTEPKATYCAPTVEITPTEGGIPPEKESPSALILQALWVFRADTENRMAKDEEEHAARMRSYMKRLEQIDEIIGGMA